MLKYSQKTLVTLSVLVILFAELTFNFMQNSVVGEQVYQDMEEELQELIELSKTQSEKLLESASDQDLKKDNVYLEAISLGQEQDIEWAVLLNQELLFWSGNVVPYDKQMLDKLERGVHFMGNGWHFVTILEKQGFKVVTFIRMMSKYSHENEHLQNHLHPNFDQSYLGKISSEPAQDFHPFPSFETGNSIYLKLEKRDVNSSLAFQFLRLLELLCLFTLVISLYGWLSQLFFHEKTKFNILLATIIIFFFRAIGLSFELPHVLYSIELFGPQEYASSQLFPSLGDLVLNVFSLFFLALIFYKTFHLSKTQPFRKGYTVLIAFAMFALGSWHIHLANTLFTNSSINLDLSQLLWFDFSSLLLVLSLVLITISLFLWMIKILQILLEEMESLVQTLLTLTVFEVIMVCLALVFDNVDLLPSVLTFCCLIVLFLIRRFNSESLSIPGVVMIVLTMAAAANIVLIHESGNKELGEREFLAKKLSLKQDPIAEYLLREHLKSMQNDFELKQLCSAQSFDKNKLSEYIKARYFQGFWDKYKVVIEICATQDTSYQSREELINCRAQISAYRKQKSKEGEPPQINVSTGERKVEYISTIQFITQADSRDTMDVMLSFESKFIREEKGYPELLLGQEQIDQTVDLNYSYARYEQGNLVAQQGNFKYEIALEKPCEQSEFRHFEKNDYAHLLYCTGDGAIVLSKPKDSIFSWLTSYSYLAAIFSLLLLFMGIVISNFPLIPDFRFQQFTVRIQLFIVVFIFVLTGVFGYITSGYVKDKYLEKNELQISEKMKSVLIEMEHKLGDQQQMEQSLYRYVESLLVKFSNVFNSDINMYDLNGMLIGSSRPKIFDKQLLGRRMDANARHAMLVDKRSEYIHEEHIGDLEYLAVYVPFRNANGEVLAYLSLPSFAKQNELEKEVGSFITTILNIYVFILAISVVVALLFANYLAKPLTLIREKIKNFRLEEKNELLDWQGDDEIGELIKEYNKMVVELEKSVQQLAKSEREGAWQEMARQVAHEIKNPLTPMKLNIQLLQRASQDNQPGLQEQLDNTAKSLIHEIDNLSRIASDFSRFAGSAPLAADANCDLVEVIKQSVQLFAAEDLDVNFDYSEEHEFKVHGDKKDLASIITNLVKNGIQAIPENQSGKIQIALNNKDGQAHVSIKDNGTGIPEEIRKDIFEPRFTTKTSGTGLGLPIVKRLIDQLGGSISFHSEENVGTEFELFIPLKSKV